MLQLLLQVAHDAALPWLWRSICLEHTAYPQARLVSLLKHVDPLAPQAIGAALQAAHDALGRPGDRDRAGPPLRGGREGPGMHDSDDRLRGRLEWLAFAALVVTVYWWCRSRPDVRCNGSPETA